jgi:hypothetical protein
MAALALHMKSHTCRFFQRRNPALYIRIRIDFGRLDLDADPHGDSGSGSESRTRKIETNNKIQKEKKYHVLKLCIFSFEGGSISCILDDLCEGVEINKLQFLIYNFFIF